MNIIPCTSHSYKKLPIEFTECKGLQEKQEQGLVGRSRKNDQCEQMVDLQVTIQMDSEYYYRSMDDEHPRFSRRVQNERKGVLRRRFKASIFNSYETTAVHLGRMLSGLRLGEFDSIDRQIKEIFNFAECLVKKESNVGHNVLQVCAKIVIVNTHLCDERVLLQHALEASRFFSDSDENVGMIPASKSAVETLLKKVRVSGKKGEREEEEEDFPRPKRRRSERLRILRKRRKEQEQEQGEKVEAKEVINCSICLEEMSQGCIASRMPCSHVFHRECIVRWLEESHYCPLCKFEMPIVV